MSRAESTEEEAAPEGLTGEARRIAATVRSLAGNLSELASLETRLAGVSVAAMCALSLITGALVLAGWIMLQLGAALWLQELGYALPTTLLATGLLNLLLAWLCWIWIKHKSRYLTFANTRAALARFQHHYEQTQTGHQGPKRSH